MNLFKISLALSCVLVPPAFAGDAGAAFMPEGKSPIEMQGSVNGEELTCKDSKKQDCQEIFDRVFDILDSSDFGVIARGNIIKGYIKFQGKKRQNVKFTSLVKEHNGAHARMICQYDAYSDEVDGLIWVDPSGR